jgi:pyruvate dehydrogenase E2 component (dihydrolipoamide acetyltransferase)
VSPGGQTASGSLKGEAAVTEPNRYERSVARRSAEIRATVPDAEFTTIVAMDAACGAASGLGVPVTALILVAVARGLREVPRLNGAYRDGRFELYSRVNLGVTIAAEGVYVVPTMFDSDTKSASALAAELADYQGRAVADRLESSELTGATFTFTDLSVDGLASGAPLIVGGQAGGLSAGAVRSVPVVRDGAVVAGREVTLTLAVDHRIIQSPDAGRFLGSVRATLEAGGALEVGEALEAGGALEAEHE